MTDVNSENVQDTSKVKELTARESLIITREGLLAFCVVRIEKFLKETKKTVKEAEKFGSLHSINGVPAYYIWDKTVMLMFNFSLESINEEKMNLAGHCIPIFQMEQLDKERAQNMFNRSVKGSKVVDETHLQH